MKQKNKQPIALQKWNALTHAERVKKKRPIVRSTEAANMLGVSTKSIQRWADSGLIRAVARSASQHRRFTRTEIERFRVAHLGEPRCPHCGRNLVSRRLAQIQARPVATGTARKGKKGGKLAK